jgi:hypothetical protein
MCNNLIAWLSRKCVAARTVFLSRRLLPLILMDMYVGVSCLDLQLLLNQLAAVVLCSLDFGSWNKVVVSKDYHHLGCETMQLVNVLQNILPPTSRLQGVRLLVGSSLQPQTGRFITRHSSFSIDANKLLSRKSTISQHSFKLSLTLTLSSHNDALVQCK